MVAWRVIEDGGVLADVVGRLIFAPTLDELSTAEEPWRRSQSLQKLPHQRNPQELPNKQY